MDASSIDFRAPPGDRRQRDVEPAGVPRATPRRQRVVAEHLARGRALLDSLGLTELGPAGHPHLDGPRQLPGPLPTVQDGPLSETGAADGGRRRRRRARSTTSQWMRDGLARRPAGGELPGPHADLTAVPGAAPVGAARVREPGRPGPGRRGTLPASALREAELVNIRQATASVTPWDILARPAAPGPALNWGQYLHDLDPAPGSPFARLAELRASLDTAGHAAHRRTRPAAHRDARRLQPPHSTCGSPRSPTRSCQRSAPHSRPRAPPRCTWAAYGWVENVPPATRAPDVTGADAAAVTRLDKPQERGG